MSCLTKISLIGHRLGGLIIRAAQPQLAGYSLKLSLYSLACSCKGTLQLLLFPVVVCTYPRHLTY